MKNLNQYIKEKLIINKDYSDGKMYHPKSFDELRQIIDDRYDKLGSGTEQNPIDFNDIDVSNLDSFCNDDDKGIFSGIKFKHIDISLWDVSNVKLMHAMFFNCEELKSVGDISNWDISNVRDMSFMFYDCENFNQNISKWDVSKVIYMNSMFSNCYYFNQNLSGWDVSNVTDTSFMFAWCKSFNQDISGWDVSNVRNNNYMFHNCPIKDEYKPKFK